MIIMYTNYSHGAWPFVWGGGGERSVVRAGGGEISLIVLVHDKRTSSG